MQIEYGIGCKLLEIAAGQCFEMENRLYVRCACRVGVGVDGIPVVDVQNGIIDWKATNTMVKPFDPGKVKVVVL